MPSNPLYDKYKNDPNWHSGGGAYGWGETPGGSTDTGTGAPTGFNSTAQDDPRMVEAYDIFKGRMSADNSQRAIDKAVGGTMDAAALGAKDLGANMARRGISGTGTGATFLNRNVFAPAQREAANQASNIALGEQDRQDRLAAGLQGPAGNIASMNLQNRRFGLDQWQAQQSEAAQRAEMERRARDEELAKWMALAQGGFGGMGGGGYRPPGNAYGMPGIGFGHGGGI